VGYLLDLSIERTWNGRLKLSSFIYRRGPAISLIFIVRISASLLRDHLVTVQQVSVGLGALLAAVSIHAVDVVIMILAGFDFASHECQEGTSGFPFFICARWYYSWLRSIARVHLHVEQARASILRRSVVQVVASSNAELMNFCGNSQSY
jgi:hypothetical protein